MTISGLGNQFDNNGSDTLTPLCYEKCALWLANSFRAHSGRFGENGGRTEMRINDIKIFPCFAEHSPKAEKMQQKEQYFTETGLLQSQIILDSQGNLIDGYTSYLLAVKYGLQSVSVKYGKRQIVRASQKSGGKLYTWELPGLLIDRVHIGDKVIVHSNKGIRTVKVAAVEDYSGQDLEPLKMAIRIKKRQSGEKAARKGVIT